jgi:hypothetical protein
MYLSTIEFNKSLMNIESLFNLLKFNLMIDINNCFLNYIQYFS